MRFLDSGTIHIKICGITCPEDADLCRDAGADALGFNFFEGSSRALDAVTALPWIQRLGGSPARVAVVVNPSAALLKSLRSAECFEFIQFHGDESPGFCSDAGFEHWIRAQRVAGPESLATALSYDSPYLLLDGYAPGSYGGTGARPDWDLVGACVREHPEKNIFLAGGLDPVNVAEAIRAVRPRAVDVASGVERQPRRKDPTLVRNFIHAAQSAG